MFGAPFLRRTRKTPSLQAPLRQSSQNTRRQVVASLRRPSTSRSILRHRSPVIHSNIICDLCKEMIIGVRHKCLDCPDFDLCSSCLSRPNPGPVEEQTPPADNVVVHNATCDLCSSSIIGDRFKCFDCPDFDVCSSCYAIVPAQHPGHSFARLHDPTDLKHSSVSLPVHRAGCNGCGKVIQGTRYKCMHPGCKDFDLCANCEALPIPIHPIAHAMLKIRQPGMYIPMVKRYGMESGPISPVVSTPSTHVSQEDVRNGVNQSSTFTNPTIFRGQTAPTDPSTVPTPVPPNIPLPETSPVPPPSLPHVPPTDFHELFDLASQFRHLLELPPVVTPLSLPVPPKETPAASAPEPTLTAVEEASLPTELALTQIDDTGTPLSLVALLSKPEKTPRLGVFDSISPGRLLSQLLDSSSAASLSPPINKKSLEEDAPLRASFIADNNIPDGQIFPPGAEFVKSWRMRNDGPGSWPAETELVFVAGDKLVIDKTERFKVGSVSPGEEVDVWTGEMKAPDVPGKYISYWRLCDSKGRRFGHSIWADICVVEQSMAPASDDDGSTSLAASSIVMPNSAPSAPSVPIPSHDESTTAPLLSDTSSVSLIDIPSDNEDEEDNEVFEDSRSHFESTPANGQLLSPDVDYVVLSDDGSDL
ncbi:hypothetical protein EDB86DRAFT_2797743 [Lactarius hatsudake]|nr:hypothetical protein EDB86DRAFT_2797743 [Lactarius hatsudake]